jgi:hypothetical protein
MRLSLPLVVMRVTCVPLVAVAGSTIAGRASPMADFVSFFAFFFVGT